MAVEVRVPSLLRKLVGGAKTVPANGTTVIKVLDDLDARHPGFKERVINVDGGLNQFVAVYVNDEDIRFLKELETPLKDGDVLSILPAVAGGAVDLPACDVEIDLKGEVCPYTFVKSKLALEEMEIGQVLKVIVDHLPAVENVPRSLANEEQEVLAVTQINDTDWTIIIRKKV